ncbi:hypothetical protein N8508_01015 [bacterium]|nr:hypothetical protein [bacterium]
MKYEVIKRCVIQGDVHDVGETLELEKELAVKMMGIGRVTPVDESKTVNRAVGVEGGEEKPKRRTRKPKEDPKVESE